MNTLSNIDEFYTVTLELDDGDLECQVLTTFEINDNGYVALVPLDDSGELDSDTVYLYRYTEDGDSFAVEYIEDDEEYDAVSAAYDEWADEQELLDSEE